MSVFHAVDSVAGPGGSSLFYSAGILISDLHCPQRITYRSPAPVLVPETAAEQFGTVTNDVFPTGIDEVGHNAFDVYYGAADAKISRIRFTLQNIDGSLFPIPRFGQAVTRGLVEHGWYDLTFAKEHNGNCR